MGYGDFEQPTAPPLVNADLDAARALRRASNVTREGMRRRVHRKRTQFKNTPQRVVAVRVHLELEELRDSAEREPGDAVIAGIALDGGDQADRPA